MSLGKRLFIGGAAADTCTTDTADIFDDNSGVALYSLDYDASDTSGNYDGTSSNVTFGELGQINYAASLNGSSSYIDLGGSAPFGDRDDIKAISGWIKANDTNPFWLYTVSGTADSFDWFYVIYNRTSNKISVFRRIDSSNYAQTDATITSDNNWHHIVAQVTATEVEIFLDGQKLTTTNTNAGSGSNTSWISYGAYGGTVKSMIGKSRQVSPAYTGGLIDQVRFFNKALSQSEVDTLYAEERCVYDSTTDNNALGGTNVAYYKFDGDATDEKGSYDGTESNITYAFGRYGSAASFNGTSSYIQTSYSPSVAATSHSFWMNPTSLTDIRPPLYFDNRGGRIDVMVGADTNDTPEASNNLVIINPSTGTNQWVHIVIVCTGWASSYTSGAYGSAITAKVYIDGVLEGTVSPTPYGQTTGMRIGRSGGSYYFEGKIDQFRAFEVALDQDDIDALYAERQEQITLNSTDPYDDGNCTQFFKLDNDVTSEVGSDGTNNGVTFQTSVKQFGTHSGNFTNDYFETNGNISNNMTFSAWVKHGNDIGRLLYAKGGVANYDWFSIFMRTSYVSASVLSRNVAVYWVTTVGNYRYYESAYKNTDASGFYHMAVTFTNTTTAPDIYINGTALTKTLTQGGTPASTFDWGEIIFGQTFINGTTSNHVGNMDQIRIFDRVLGGDEVFQLYSEGILDETT